MKFLANTLITIFFIFIFLKFGPSLLDSIKNDYKGYLTHHTKIGVIEFNEPVTNAAPFRNTLTKFFKDHSMKAILLKFNCKDNGSLGSSQEIFMTINRLKKQYPKPIIGFIENFCFANNYYIASATDYLIAMPGSLIGDINNDSNTLFNISDKNLTVEQASLDAYTELITSIAQARNLPLNDQKLWSNGTIFTGKQALNNYLIDATDSFHLVLATLQKLAPLEGTIIWISDKNNYFINDNYETTSDSE